MILPNNTYAISTAYSNYYYTQFTLYLPFTINNIQTTTVSVVSAGVDWTSKINVSYSDRIIFAWCNGSAGNLYSNSTVTVNIVGFY